MLAGAENCFVWRLRIPFNEVDSPRNYLTKVMTYSRLLEAANSLSQLDDFVQATLECWQKRVPFGTYNVTNPGHVTTREVVDLIRQSGVNLDKLTYAGNRATLADVEENARHTFVHGDICDAKLLAELFAEHAFDAAVHFAAESHVDRSIDAPEAFLLTNVLGTFRLLDAARRHWKDLPPERAAAFRFLHVSTDEVYGSLGADDPAFSETTPFAPNSPYAASKAGSDHFARAYFHTYGLPVVTTNCSNNYGPHQFPEKLIPLMILNALDGKPLPI